MVVVVDFSELKNTKFVFPLSTPCFLFNSFSTCFLFNSFSTCFLFNSFSPIFSLTLSLPTFSLTLSHNSFSTYSPHPPAFPPDLSQVIEEGLPLIKKRLQSFGSSLSESSPDSIPEQDNVELGHEVVADMLENFPEGN